MAGAPRLAAVTGATGFLGRRLVPALTARGWRVRILARDPAAASFDGAAPEIVRGDLDDTAALAALTEGCDVVVHVAGAIKALDRAAFFAVNQAGARRLAESMGPGRMLMVSSLAARSPELSNYAASKRAGETVARDILGERLTVVRPPAIYGPGDRETLGLFKLAAAAPFLPAPDDPAARLALAHVDDVVTQLIGRLNGEWRPETFAIGGARPEGYGWREIFATAATAMGRSPRLVPLPLWIISAAAAVSETAAQLRRSPAIFNRGKARELRHSDWSVSPAELPPEGADGCVDLATGFARTVAWYREAGWL